MSHRHDLLAAIERAVRYGAYSRSAIERILAIRATPKTALDTLAEKEQQQLKSLLGDDPVRPRSGKDYQKLLDDQASEARHAENEQNAKEDPANRGEESAESGAAQDRSEDDGDDADEGRDEDDDASACAGGV